MNALAKIRGLFEPRDMSVGTPWKRIAEFAFPMLIGNFAQQLYNTVDAVVVGRSKWGYTALAAVGNALPVLNLLLALLLESQPEQGYLYHSIRRKDSEKLGLTIGNCLTVTSLATVTIMIVGPLVTGPMLRLMRTLPEVYEGCRDYLNIFFIGISGFFFYNILAGVLRGLGDSFSALVILFASAFRFKFVGDVCCLESMGIAGVALATLYLRYISGLCFIRFAGLIIYLHFHGKALDQKGIYFKDSASGIPSGITQAIFSCAMLVVQALINSFKDASFLHVM